MEKINIAIDGPSGAGKSTVAKIVASKLSIVYLDTGAMYRATALKFLNEGVNMDDEEYIINNLNSLDISIKYIDGEQHILLDGKDVSKEIRLHHMSKAASDISKIKEVRIKLVDLQRKIASENNVIMDGRDIGSYVLPDSKHKFFLTASAEVRAKRRYDELISKGQSADYSQILEDINIRDKNDSTRSFAPLKKTSDATEIDSTFLTVDEVCKQIISKVKGE